MKLRWWLQCNICIDINQMLLTSVREALVRLIVTLLLLWMLAHMLMVSPGTYPPLSSLTLQDTGPDVMQLSPSLCSISQWNGCWNKIREHEYKAFWYFLEQWTYSKNRRLQVQVDGAHNNEDLLVFVSEAVGFPEGSFAEILDPTVFAKKCWRQP